MTVARQIFPSTDVIKKRTRNVIKSIEDRNLNVVGKKPLYCLAYKLQYGTDFLPLCVPPAFALIVIFVYTAEKLPIFVFPGTFPDATFHLVLIKN